MTRPCIRNCTINYTLSIVNSYRAYLVIKYQTLHYLLLILVGNAANDGNILKKQKHLKHVVSSFPWRCTSASPNLHVTMFLFEEFPAIFHMHRDFPKSGRQFEQVHGKGLPEMILPKKYRPSWSMIYTCEYIYIWQCVKTLYPWWTST